MNDDIIIFKTFSILKYIFSRNVSNFHFSFDNGSIWFFYGLIFNNRFNRRVVNYSSLIWKCVTCSQSEWSLWFNVVIRKYIYNYSCWFIMINWWVFFSRGSCFPWLFSPSQYPSIILCLKKCHPQYSRN